MLGDVLCQTLYGSETAGQYLKLYALLIPMLYCDAVTDAMTKGLGQQKACVRYNIITSTLDVVLLFFLLPRWGMTGYFISFLVTHLINFLLSLRRLLLISRTRIRLRIPVCAIAATVFAVQLSATLTRPLIRCSAYLIILGCLLFLLQVLKKEDILWIKGLIAKR